MWKIYYGFYVWYLGIFVIWNIVIYIFGKKLFLMDKMYENIKIIVLIYFEIIVFC